MFFKLFASVLLISSTLAQASSSNSLSGTPVPPPYSSSPVTGRVGQASEESVQVKFPVALQCNLMPLNVSIMEVRKTRAIGNHNRKLPLKFCLNYTPNGNCPYEHRCQFVHSMVAHEAFKQFIDSKEQAPTGVSPISNASVGYIIEGDNSPANADDELSSRSISPVDSPYLVRQAAAPHLIFEGNNKYRRNPYGLIKPHAEVYHD